MADSDITDDTSADYAQFEKALLAQDRDITGVETADVDDATAQRLDSELIDADVVTAVPEDRVLVREPSGTAFDSATQLAVFHRGWTAARGADETAGWDDLTAWRTTRQNLAVAQAALAYDEASHQLAG